MSDYDSISKCVDKFLFYNECKTKFSLPKTTDKFTPVFAKPRDGKGSRGIKLIDETQKNIFLVRAHVGFERDADGFPDLNRPIVEDMRSASLSGKPVLAKAYNYEIPELGIVKDKFMPTIYNNLLYIKD